jgi:peptide/nickel transport system substrate-binding protein
MSRQACGLHGKMKRQAAIIICILSFFVVSKEGVSSERPRNARYGGTLVWGVYTRPTPMNPLMTTGSISMSLQGLIFNSLVRMNAHGEIEPDLAESWEVSPDGRVYTFHLRRGVRFHDGIAVTAEDVKYTYDMILDPLTASPFRYFFALIAQTRVLDAVTFQITLKKPSIPFIYWLTKEILPRHLVQAGTGNIERFGRHPVGSGPFMFKEWREDDTITLEANPDYYEGRPYLDAVVVKTYNDARDVWTALMRGEVDYAGFIEKDDFEVARRDPSFRTFGCPVQEYYGLVYNMDDAILQDKRIRQAFAYGINSDEVIERAAGGYGSPCRGPFPPFSIGYNAQAQPFLFYPDKAMELLRSAGWQDKDNDGILEKDNEKLTLRVLVDMRNDMNRKIVMVLRQQFQAIGARIEVIEYDDDSQLTSEFFKEQRPQAHVKLMWTGTDPAEDMINWCSQSPPSDDNLWQYRNAEVESLYEQGETMADKEKRQTIYREIYAIINDEQPVLFLYIPYLFHAIRSEFRNTDDFFCVNMPVYSMKDWYVDKGAARNNRQKGGERTHGDHQKRDR